MTEEDDIAEGFNNLEKFKNERETITKQPLDPRTNRN